MEADIHRVVALRVRGNTNFVEVHNNLAHSQFFFYAFVFDISSHNWPSINFETSSSNALTFNSTTVSKFQTDLPKICWIILYLRSGRH